MDGVTYRTDDVAKWGTGKGSNLTPTEVDLNFWEVYSRLKYIEDHPPVPVMITDIVVIGSTFQINMSDGSHYGPFDLPIAILEWTGEWVNSMVYAKLDLVTVAQQGLYIVMYPHTSPPTGPFNENATDPTSGNPLYIKIFGESSYIYDFGFFYPGKPGIGIDDGFAIAGHIFVRDVTLPVGMIFNAELKVAAGAALSFPIQIDDVAAGSINFASGSRIGTLTWTTEIVATAGQRFTLMKPSPIDASARELSITFQALRIFP